MPNKPDLYVEKLGLYLHRKFEVHLLIIVIFNIISFIVVMGVFQLLNYPLVDFGSVIGVIIYSLVNTVILEVIKLFVVRHLINLIFKTKGLLFIPITMFIFWLTSLIFIDDLTFRKNVLVNLTIFTVCYLFMKILLVIALQRVRKEDDNNEKLD